MRCEDLAEVLPELADAARPGDVVGDPVVLEHVETCLRCQAELARYRKLLRALQLLRTRSIEPAPGLFAETLTALEVAAERRVMRATLTGRKMAYAGAIGGAAVAAGGAAVAVLIARSRQRHSGLAS
jgi:hypothetical protein